MRRSLLVAHCLRSWLGGTQVWLYNQIRWLPADVTCHAYVRRQTTDEFPLRRPDRLVVLGARRQGVRLRLPGQRPRHYRPALRHLWRRRRPDVVHSHFGDFAWRMRDIVKDLGIPHVVTFYGHDVTRVPTDPVWRGRYMRLWPAVDRVLCEGPHMKRRIAELGCPAERIHVHHLGVDLAALPYRPRSWTPGTPLRILMAAAFREKKGLPYGIEALGRLVGDHDIELSLIGASTGSAESDHEARRIDSALSATGLDAQVRRLGFVPHDQMVQQAYSHHIFLSPSVHAADGDTEGGAPVSIIEMAATGMPIVSTTHCDIPDVIHPAGHALLAGERDVDGLERILRDLLADPAGWRPMLDAVRGRIEAEYDGQTQAAALAAHYRDLAGVR